MWSKTETKEVQTRFFLDQNQNSIKDVWKNICKLIKQIKLFDGIIDVIYDEVERLG